MVLSVRGTPPGWREPLKWGAGPEDYRALRGGVGRGPKTPYRTAARDARFARGAFARWDEFPWTRNQGGFLLVRKLEVMRRLPFRSSVPP